MAYATSPNSSNTMTLDLPRRFPWPTLLSVAIHGAVVAGLLYTSVHQVIEQPSPTQPIEITMVAPADLEPPPAAQPVVEPVVEPEPEPEPEVAPEPPKEAPVVIHKPKPKPKPEKKVEQPKREVKPAAEPRPASPFENNNTAPARTAPSTSTAAAKPTVTAPSGPRAISRVQPSYPPRAQALRIEGTVRVKFDVSPDGRIDNLQILSAQPANMFEREVKSAMRRWRYEQGRPGSGVTMTIKFRLNGVEIN